jgi:hypothetical protein
MLQGAYTSSNRHAPFPALATPVAAAAAAATKLSTSQMRHPLKHALFMLLM